MALHAVNPATGETIQTYDEMTPAAVGHVITQAHNTFLDWKQTHVCRTRPHDAACRPYSA